MIVNRLTFNAKQETVLELVEFLMQDRKRGGYNYRLYRSNIGTFDQVAFEFEFEDLAAFDKFWAEWYQAPETPAFLEKFQTMAKSGGSNEIWYLIE